MPEDTAWTRLTACGSARTFLDPQDHLITEMGYSTPIADGSTAITADSYADKDGNTCTLEQSLAETLLFNVSLKTPTPDSLT